jgi:hypothetical protein
LRAAALRSDADRRRAALRACRDNARVDAVRRLARPSAPFAARDRRGDGRVRFRAARLADCALRLVDAFAFAGGDGSFTPALRAFDRPIAMACFVERAPCLPSRT